MYAKHSKPEDCYGEGKELTDRMSTQYDTALNRQQVKKEKKKETINKKIAKSMEELEQMKAMAADLDGDES
eukprot:scaffold5964_cov62-Skeletonema_dohrnii-CCMP3373.AAC.1